MKRIIYILLIVIVLILTACNQEKRQVVVYTSVDQVYSEPLFEQFEKDTGIKVLPNYDVEASKTTGLVAKLMAEKDNPVADVFWNGEFSQTMKLKQEDVLQPYISTEAQSIPDNYKDEEGYWTAFGGRARVILVNTDLMKPSEYPDSIYDFVDSQYEGYEKALAKPLFGTTATQAASLYALFGQVEALAYYQSIDDNHVRIVDGNSVVRDLVADGELAFGLTDTDDALGALERGKPVALVFPDQDEEGIGTLIIPNTVALVKGAKSESC